MLPSCDLTLLFQLNAHFSAALCTRHVRPHGTLGISSGGAPVLWRCARNAAAMASEYIALYDSWVGFAQFCLRVDEFMCGDVYRYPSLTTRQPRDRLNPMELYSDDEFTFRYRFSKGAVVKMLEELCLRENSDNRGAPLPPLLKLLIALRFYGSGAMQTVVGDLVNVSQPTVSNVLWEITQAVCLRLFPKYVRLPNATEGKALMTRFYKIGKFPGVTGCIDCTHVQIISPGGDCAEVYRNRKGVFSINVQVSVLR